MASAKAEPVSASGEKMAAEVSPEQMSRPEMKMEDPVTLIPALAAGEIPLEICRLQKSVRARVRAPSQLPLAFRL